MTRTIGDRIAEAAGHNFVGRERELAALSAAAISEEPPFLVAFVCGPGGIGKSTLVRRLLAGLPPHVRQVLLDARDVEPTPRGFHHALGQSLGLGGEPDAAALARALAAGPSVLVIDAYEALGLLDSWLRTSFLRTLPASTLTVLAGRDRPATAWHTAAGWPGLVAEFPIGPLSDAETSALLRIRGLDGDEAHWASSLAHGHPLALELATATLRADPQCMQRPPMPPAGLLEAFLGQLPPGTVMAVEAAATVRRVTEPILAAVLGSPESRSAFDKLRALPFTEHTEEGLLLHDIVRDTVGQDLALRDPARRRTYRQRAVHHLTAHGGDGTQWAHTADLMFLIENPVVREACFPSARPAYSVEPAEPDDMPVIAQIVAAHETPEAATILAAWCERHPETFAVARGQDGSVAAFVQIADLTDLDRDLLAADPLSVRWVDHLRANPPGRDDQILVMRRWLGRESGELRSQAVSACWLDVKRIYMQLRPRLRRTYSDIVDLQRLGPIFVPLGFAPAGEPVDLGGALHHPVWLDFGPGSVDGWLAGLVGAETTGAPAKQVVSVAGLSCRELEVLRSVAEGRSNREIGSQLFISEKTASRHVSNIFVKLGVRTRAAAARIAAEQGVTQA